MNTVDFIPVKTDAEIQDVAILASEIWHDYFIDIISEEQIDYMLDKFQSYSALKEQIENGYEYFKIYSGHTFAGFFGIHEEDGELFLSKLYLHKDSRHQHLSTQAFHYMLDLCRVRGLKKIWLTCNRHNKNSLDIYQHWGFSITREQKTDIGSGFCMDDYILEYDTAASES